MFFLLLLIWVLLNGRITVEIVLVGAAVSAALSLAARRILELPPWTSPRLLRRMPRAFCYVLYLVWQVLRANFQVMGYILRPGRRQTAPRLVRFTPELNTPMARLILANSITLTPGTVTVLLGEKELCVYAMDAPFAQGLSSSGFVRRLKRLEEGKK